MSIKDAWSDLLIWLEKLFLRHVVGVKYVSSVYIDAIWHYLGQGSDIHNLLYIRNMMTDVHELLYDDHKKLLGEELYMSLLGSTEVLLRRENHAGVSKISFTNILLNINEQDTFLSYPFYILDKCDNILLISEESEVVLRKDIWERIEVMLEVRGVKEWTDTYRSSQC